MKHRVQHGQSMVEYALILALVALVAIVILSLVGWSAQGATGLVVGALKGPGGKVSSSSSLVILSVKCQAGVKIVIDLYLGPEASPSDLYLRNDAPDWAWDGSPSSIPIVSGLAPNYSCPRTVVVQHRKSGAIAAAGVQQVVFP